MDIKSLINKNILDIIPYEPGKPIKEVQKELGLQNIIKMASNENPLGTSPKAVKALKEAASSVQLYPDGKCFYLREKLSKKLGVKPTELIFGNGSNEIIEFIIHVLH